MFALTLGILAGNGSRSTGADAVLVACLDLSGVLRHARVGLPLHDAAGSLAEAIVARRLAERGSGA